jgi:hypothetical protein
VITQHELAALKEAATRASQDSMNAQQEVNRAQMTLDRLKIKAGAAQQRARDTGREYQTAVQQFHVQQQRRPA